MREHSEQNHHLVVGWQALLGALLAVLFHPGLKQIGGTREHISDNELTAALNRGWENRDSRVAMLLQQERAAVKIAVEPEQLRLALERDGK